MCGRTYPMWSLHIRVRRVRLKDLMIPVLQNLGKPICSTSVWSKTWSLYEMIGLVKTLSHPHFNRDWFNVVQPFPRSFSIFSMPVFITWLFLCVGNLVSRRALCWDVFSFIVSQTDLLTLAFFKLTRWWYEGWFSSLLWVFLFGKISNTFCCCRSLMCPLYVPFSLDADQWATGTHRLAVR